MKKYLLPVRPEWLEKILNGEKTVEIRTRIPVALRNGEAVEFYLYCTKGLPSLFRGVVANRFFTTNHNCIIYPTYLFPKSNGLVPCKFKAEVVKIGEIIFIDGIHYRVGTFPAEHAIHITSLSILERPMALGEFGKWEEYGSSDGCGHMMPDMRFVPLTRAPRGFQRVEVGK